MKDSNLFLALAELYQSFVNPKASPMDIAELGVRVQTSGKGDPTYPLTVVTCFHDAVGKDWDDFLEYYSPTKKLSESFERSVSQRARRFWERVDDSRFELERLAAYMRMKSQ